MQQFYHPNIDAESASHFFDEQESKHIARVLRKKSGDTIRLTNGKGFFFKGVLDVLSPKKCVVRLTSHERIATQSPYVHMAVAPTKNMDRFEWFLEKATELGVQRITPILCERSERKAIKHERCTKIVVAALKQSLGVHMPLIDPLTPLEDVQTDALSCFMAHCADSPKKALKDVVLNQTSICIMIGPEGDFSNKEINWASKKQIDSVHLGSLRLRTETAALVACHTALLLNKS
jgi:16S rRNA (uracil1498-N3)-methyltransferase